LISLGRNFTSLVVRDPRFKKLAESFGPMLQKIMYATVTDVT
jgi:hypothetical protein